MRKRTPLFSKPVSILFVLLFSAFSVFAQTTITGRVTDANGAGLPGITVTAKGTKVATSTSSDGSYSLSVPAKVSTLIFTSVGYATQQLNIAGRSGIDVVLQSSATDLNAVVVIGYGTRQKKDLTGSVTQVSSKDFQKGVITTPEQMIAGKVAGVSIISNSGQPGAGSTIRIRGGSSLLASNDPLIIIDGVPLENSSIAGVSNPLSLINSNDIESFTILKDASATAIYGNRASNGVIIITTKKGRSGKLKVDFSTVNSLSQIIKEVSVLSADQVRAVVNASGTAAQKAMIGTANTDWQKQIYQTALSTNNNISFSGGLKNIPYRVSLGYLNQDGILKTDNLQKVSAAVVFNPTFFDNHLKVDINIKGSNEQARFANQGAIGSAVYFDPTQPVYSNNKKFGGYFEWLSPSVGNSSLLIPNPLAARNPVGQLMDRHDNSNVNRSIGNIQLDYKFHFLPDLHANLNLGYDISRGTGKIFISDSSGIGYGDPTNANYVGGGTNNQYKSTKTNTVAEFYFNYTKDIGSIKSHLDAQAGYSYNDFITKNYAFASYYANSKMVPGSTPTFPYDQPQNTLISVFGRVYYAYNDKYLLTASIRDDGSSRFAKSDRWGLFPSAAFAWRIKNEDFLKNNTTISDLKLRIGYGLTGQQDIPGGDYGYLSRYSLSNTTASYPFGNTNYQGYRPSGYDPNLKWEQTATTNLGLDYGFAKNRITGSIDYYYRRTTNLLNSIPQSAGSNFSAYVTANVGDMTNKGIEFSVNVQPIKRADLTWDVSFNATYNKNTITNLTVIPDDPNYPGFQGGGVSGAQGYVFINTVGYPKNTFNLYHQIYDSKGHPLEGLFEDVNRDGIINENDKYKGQSADPNLFFGFSTNLSYKKWNAGFVLRASFNNYVYNNIYSNNGRQNQILGAQTTANASSNYLTTLFVGNTENEPLSDYYVENASFLKMDNLYVGYNLGKIMHNKANLGLNFSVQNVFTITKYDGLDPEISNGIDNNLYPRPRIFSLGLNLGL